MILIGDNGGAEACLTLLDEKKGSLHQIKEASFRSREYNGFSPILKISLVKPVLKLGGLLRCS